ncbi:MAG TPA: extracellular matrix/biofilm biosynthesis regulator RemA family protein [Bacteroidales bacterium]|jgi:extracellular matrix regulatory protein B|nr:extracellular matrix/biofilm biosynthesis regulator RemA family protein [Bacteroidales bacterium]
MFLHIGSDYVVPLEEVVFIIDAALLNTSATTRSFIERIKSEKQIIDLTEESPKSYVITEDKIIYSPISSGTLQRRGEVMKEIEKYSVY